jgi:hypothetical protein
MVSTFGASEGATGFATEAIRARESEAAFYRPGPICKNAGRACSRSRLDQSGDMILFGYRMMSLFDQAHLLSGHFRFLIQGAGFDS